MKFDEATPKLNCKNFKKWKFEIREVKNFQKDLANSTIQQTENIVILNFQLYSTHYAIKAKFDLSC